MEKQIKTLKEVQVLFSEKKCNILLVKSLENLQKDDKLQHIIAIARSLRSLDFQLVDGRFIRGEDPLEKAKYIASKQGGVKIYRLNEKICAIEEKIKK